MIVTTLADCGRYEGLHPSFKKLFDYIKVHDLLHADLGRIEIDGDNLFINNSNPACIEADKQVLEMHRNYIDVQMLLEGEETVGWKSLAEIEHYTQEYKKESDCALSDDKPTVYLKLHPGQIYILWPEDAHAPIIGKGKIRKIIGKVKI